MLGQLVESSPRRVRRRFSTLVSVAAHVVVLSAAVAAARPVPEHAEINTVVAWHPPAPLPPGECSGCAAPSPGGSQGRTDRDHHSLPGPITSQFTFNVPENAGPVIESMAITSDEWRVGTPAGRPGDTTPALGRAVVDREVVPLRTNPVPRYPATLRAARIEGSVSARFVVDTTGRVIMESVIVDAADHPLFTDAVIEALRRARFSPAELRGRKVRQLVAQPFVFVIRD
jgi:protein TonB